MILAKIILFVTAHKKIILYGAAIAVLAVLVFAARNCYLDHKTAQTKKVLDDLKAKEAVIEDALNIENPRAEEKAAVAEKKVEEAEKAVEKIEKIHDIDRTEAIRLMCEYEKSQGRANALCK